MLAAIEPFSKFKTIREIGGGTIVIAMYANELAQNFVRFHLASKLSN